MPTDPKDSANEPTVTCFYCGLDKPRSEFSDEHIWPDGLGGDFLSEFWRTDDVCAQCNAMSGVFVDGAFIRSWAGSAERGRDAQQYLSIDEPLKTVLPLDYLGKLSLPDIGGDEVADWWVGPCGATIVHFRPKETEELWTTYLGGDPRAKKARAGRAYIALASSTEFWIHAALASFKQHFKRSKRYVVNMAIPPEWKAFAEVDRADPAQAADLRVFDTITAAAEVGDSIRASQTIRIDVGHRFMCKLGLAVGCQLFGPSFGDHPSGEILRRAFREPNPERRRQYPIKGSGYFNEAGDSPLSMFRWPGGWVLILQFLNGALILTVIAPSGRPMLIEITDDATLGAQLSQDHQQGLVWITVPPLGKAAGPLPLPNYVAHLTGSILDPNLSLLEAARIDPATLPPC